MSSATWITMIAITGFVWGGFFVVVRTAFRKEAAKGPDNDAV
jgi:LPS O-antigen subunit length determinant protein (WzzB/FepE family)